jgi:hypothetical protein
MWGGMEVEWILEEREEWRTVSKALEKSRIKTRT